MVGLQNISLTQDKEVGLNMQLSESKPICPSNRLKSPNGDDYPKVSQERFRLFSGHRIVAEDRRSEENVDWDPAGAS